MACTEAARGTRTNLPTAEAGRAPEHNRSGGPPHPPSGHDDTVRYQYHWYFRRRSHANLFRTAFWAVAAVCLAGLHGRRGLAPVLSLVPIWMCVLLMRSSIARARTCAGLARLAEDAVRQHR